MNMKLFWWIGIPVLALGFVAVRYFLMRRREQLAQKNGVAVYATVVSLEMATFLGKPSPVSKITIWIQEPGKDRREIVLSTRVPANQKIDPGMMLPIVVDPSDPKRVYPCGPDAMKRIQLTGSREQRRQMKRQLS